MRWIIIVVMSLYGFVFATAQETNEIPDPDPVTYLPYNPTPIRNKCLYWYYNNISTNVPKADSIVIITPNADTNINWNLNWKIENPPEKETIDAIDQATADTAIAAYKANKEADDLYEKSNEVIMLKATLLELKASNPAMNLPTKAAIIARFKTLKGN